MEQRYLIYSSVPFPGKIIEQGYIDMEEVSISDGSTRLEYVNRKLLSDNRLALKLFPFETEFFNQQTKKIVNDVIVDKEPLDYHDTTPNQMDDYFTSIEDVKTAITNSASLNDLKIIMVSIIDALYSIT